MIASWPTASAVARTRVCWVGDAAAAVWLPRLRACVEALRKIDLAAVQNGERECALVTVPASSLGAVLVDCERSGIAAVPVALDDDGASPLDPPGDLGFSVCAARADRLDAAVAAFASRDAAAFQTLLGYPRCCIAAAVAVATQGRSDPAWSMLEAAPEAQDRAVAFPPETNTLLRALGIAAVEHIPCGPECAVSRRAAMERVTAGRRLGLTTAMDDLLDLLGWRMSWTLLHGIAEVKTPVLKFSTPSDAVPGRARLLRAGTAPEEIGRGGVFPYVR